MIDEKAIVACYVDAAAILAMVVLLLQSGHLRKRNTLPLRIYYILSWQVLFTAVCCFVFNAMYRQSAPWSHTVALISRTLWDYSVLAVDYLWLTYVDVKLFGSRKRGSIARIIRILPLIIFLVLLVINLFTGIVFTITEDNSLQPKPLFSLMTLTMILYFCTSALIVWYFDRKKTKVRFLHIEPMIISVVIALIPQYTTPYGTGILGFVIGITLLYFSMIDEFSFLDEESQLYNERFLSYFFDNTMARKNIVQSALILEADGYLPAGFEILRNTLHQNNDVIRIDEKKFLMFSGSESLSALQLLSTHVEEAVKAHNDEHPKEKTQITVRCRMRKEDENVYTFFRKVVEEKDAGDPIHGVVSMISELDRLDKELKLAADIQLNALPMNFPPFPDRTEFDLYASMTPAKEVGGDFYDFFMIDEDHLALVIADVSGKGVPAALFMMTSKTLIKNHLISGCDPAAAMERVNLQLCDHNDSRMFVTVWLAVVEISTGKGLACNAGHENPCFRRYGEDFEVLKYRHNIFAGISKKAKYQNREFELHPGDCIFVYTDGVPEANNTLEEMFGETRLIETLNQNPDATPEALIGNVYDAVDLFDENTPQFDDITMLCFKYYGIDKKTEDE
ncbi:MAG: PP2C family protein-serine/threonine phosphatase [Oscillospiraceae bacterium]|nr:PP2C family protein-serine/threonine phosphatase [Oscillospiraceae bacterium]